MRYKISIYISNVPLWMEELDLWNSFSERISTIYLPDRKRPMMPLALSNCVCSLCEHRN
jgi:exoribonuclease R